MYLSSKIHMYKRNSDYFAHQVELREEKDK